MQFDGLYCTPDLRDCLCNNPNFGYGIRDCAAAICNQSDAALAVTEGWSFCSRYLNMGSSTSKFVDTISAILIVYELTFSSSHLTSTTATSAASTHKKGGSMFSHSLQAQCGY
jgi:hypothetical protein